MLQLDNHTPFLAELAAFPDERGVDCLVVAIKATFRTYPQLALADTQREVERADRIANDSGPPSLAAAGELCLGKVGTDVLMQGHALAPGGRPTSQGAVSLAAADRRLVAAVFGDRRWETLGISPPQPWERMPIAWERAFGGSGVGGSKEIIAAAARNPVGVGLPGRVGEALPNFENPRALIDGRGDRPEPVCFAPIAPSWTPRVGYAGTYDAAWARRRAPYLPSDFDPRFYSVAPGPLALRHFLEGGEPVEAVGVSAQGAIRFGVPRCDVRVRFCMGRSHEEAPVRLQTVHLFPDDDEVALTFGTTFRAGRRLLTIERVRIELARIELEAAA